MDAMANNTQLANDFVQQKKVTLSCVLARSFMWPLLMESLHENGMQSQLDPIKGIGNLALVVEVYSAAVSAAAPMVGVSRKS